MIPPAHSESVSPVLPSPGHSLDGNRPINPLEASGATPDGVDMQDVTMLLFTVVFFGLAFLYVKACQKLR
jgi:hypothetical protein